MTNTDRPAASCPVTTRRIGLGIHVSDERGYRCTLPYSVAAGISNRLDCGSHLPLDHHPLDLGDGLGGVQALRAGLGAVHDGVAAVEAERILEIVEAQSGRLVAAVLEPAVRLKQRGGAEETLAVPPIARAGGRAARAQDALVEAVELLPVIMALPPLLLRRRRGGLQPRLDRGMLGIEVGEFLE